MNDRLNADPAGLLAKKLQQKYVYSGSTGDTYVVVVWARGDNIPAAATKIEYIVKMKYADLTANKVTVPLTTGTYGYSPFQTTITAAQAYINIKVQVVYKATTGTLTIDDIWMVQTAP